MRFYLSIGSETQIFNDSCSRFYFLQVESVSQTRHSTILVLVSISFKLNLKVKFRYSTILVLVSISFYTDSSPTGILPLVRVINSSLELRPGSSGD